MSATADFALRGHFRARKSAFCSGARAALEDRLSCAQVWEDPAVLQGALRVGPDDDVLSICSAGDNAFALAIAGARSVTCVDGSVPQLALAELKLRAAVELPLVGFRSLLGLDEAGRRIYLYHQVRDALGERARTFWNQHEELIRLGVLGQGVLERYLATFRDRILPLVHSRATVDELLSLDDLEVQRQFYVDRWNSWRWRALFRTFFSRRVMARFGRSAEQFRYVQGPVADVFLARARRVLTELPVAGNPYLQWILGGRYPDMERAHPYLSAVGHDALRRAADRIQFVHGDLLAVLERSGRGAFSAFNYSDVPEYLSEQGAETLLRATADAARPGARIAYWNLLVPRHRPESLADRIARETALGEALITEDRAFFHGALQVERVL